jgi:hypothetical protein
MPDAVTLPIAPPYSWGRTYSAASNMSMHLPGLMLSQSVVVQPTKEGFDVHLGEGQAEVRVIVSPEHSRPLQPGDPVTLTSVPVAEGVLKEEQEDGSWAVRTRVDGKLVELGTFPATSVVFSWAAGRDIWASAVCLAPHLVATRSFNWLGVATLEPEAADARDARRALAVGDPAALWDTLQHCGRGITLLERCGDGGTRWRVRVEDLALAAEGHAPLRPTELEVAASSVAALPNWPFLGVSVACLRAFAAAHAQQLGNATTEEACERVCKPLTERASASLAACLQRVGAVDQGVAPRSNRVMRTDSVLKAHAEPTRARVCAQLPHQEDRAHWRGGHSMDD